MGKGDCAVGAKHAAEIGGIMRQLDKYDKKQTYICEQIEAIKDDLIDFKLSFKTWLVGLLVSIMLLLVGVLVNIVISLANGGG